MAQAAVVKRVSSRLLEPGTVGRRQDRTYRGIPDRGLQSTGLHRRLRPDGTTASDQAMSNAVTTLAQFMR